MKNSNIRSKGARRSIHAALLSVPLLAGCTSNDRAVEQSWSGYSSIVFTRYTKIQDHAFNIYSFNAGTRLVADRETSDGRPLYCGTFNVNDDPKPYNGCFGFEAPSTIVIGIGAGFKEVRRPQPAGVLRVEQHRL